ncbi:MAG TPA: TlpA disulfide reductase family protein [Beijerinckiaceae bacterium]|nr:TlpA disulfide reductase family protein [Beijerinckiaceae bacterium]
MTDADPQTPPSPAPGPTRRWLALGASMFAILAVSLVLYGMKGQDGKEMAATSCADARAVAERLAPFARGEVAALDVDDNPKPLADLSFDAAQGEKRALADFRGRTLLLNLWATWCIPCRQEMPALDRLEAKLGGPDFEVVAINVDTARLDRRQAFLDEAGVKSLAFYADPSAGVFESLQRAGKVVGLPTSLLVDPRGCALGTMAGPAQWDSQDGVNLVMAALGK